MSFPSDLRYTNDHEWLRVDGARCRVGITQFAVSQLGDIVLVEVPAEGRTVARGEAFGTIESVKSVSELYAPISGRVVAVNATVRDAPETVNTAPYGEGWLIEIEPSDKQEINDLLTPAQYEALTNEAG